MDSLDDEVEFVRNLIRTWRAPVLPVEATVPEIYLDARAAHHEYAEIGFELLRSRKVAALMFAGGMSTRMGGGPHRGNLAVGPVTGRSIFRLQGEKIAAIKKRYAPSMPWFVMTSPLAHTDVVGSFQRENYFGISPDEIRLFMQTSLPVLDANQNPIQLADGTFLKSPTGHGGMLDGLSRSGLLKDMIEAGIDYIFSFQYPNVLERVCDPIMLGYHHSGGFDVTTKAIFECRPGEKMGRCVEVNGKLQVAEYHFFNNNHFGNRWEALPASIGTHIWSTSFIQRCVERGIELPFQVVTHNAEINASGPLLKVERFVFDLLPYANATGLIIAARDEEYAAVKSMDGPDSLESGRNALCRLYRKWLDRAGAISQVPEQANCSVEISPLYALDSAELSTKLPLGFGYDDGLVLE